VLARCIYDLYPEELMDTIKKAYDEGLIHPGYVEYEAFTEVLKAGKKQCLEKLRKQVENKQIKNIHEYMAWWACFNQPGKTNPDISSAKNKQKQDSKTKKSKKKQSKQSKKANRKKK
jgi:hypothetical protein